jgi:hypothetical protein
MPTMATLSVRQPFAAFLVTGLKTVEVRSRRTRHRGPLLIHASLQPRPLEVQFKRREGKLPPDLLATRGRVIGVRGRAGLPPVRAEG